MALTERIANSLGEKARSILNINEDNEKVIVYGAIGLLQVLWSILWTIAISMIFGVVYEALLFSIVVSALKKYSGGAHASSPSRCIFMGVTISIIFGLLIKILLSTQNIIVVSVLAVLCISVAFFIIIKLAPVDSVNKPITNLKMRKRLKRSSEILMFLYIFIMMITLLIFRVSSNLYFLKAFECISLGALWQSITLTKIGIKVLNKVDFIMNFKIIKGGN
jgi:accessory gene regulator B